MKNLQSKLCLITTIFLNTYSFVKSWNNNYEYNEYTQNPIREYQQNYYNNYNINHNNNNNNMNNYFKLKCNCKLLKHCQIMIDIIYNAEKPLSTKFIKTIRKTNCGYDGNEPLVCCPDPRYRRASFTNDGDQTPWIWDIVENPKNNEDDNPLPSRNSNDDNLNYDNNYNYHHRPYTFSHGYEIHHNNNNNNNNHYYNNKHHHNSNKDNYFFDFEDPKTQKNCPPSFSTEFELSDEFKNVKPIKSKDPIINPEINAINTIDVTTEVTVVENRQPDSVQISSSSTDVVSNIGDKKLLINTPLCGLSVNTRIIGGEDAGPGQFPWMARIAYRNKSSDRVTYRCAGAVISDRYIVTAAHCVTNLIEELEVVLVRLGELDTRTNICGDGQAVCSEPQDYQIETIVYHQNYDQPKYSNDIALIRLQRLANSSFISPLCLPIDQYAVLDQNAIGTNGIIAGWGAMNPGSTISSPLLQSLRLPIVDTVACAASYARFSANSRIPILVGNGQLCAQGRENADACQGDSGGPLMSEGVTGADRYTLLGLVSFGPRTCGVSNFPGVYTRMAAYMNWILDNIEM